MFFLISFSVTFSTAQVIPKDIVERITNSDYIFEGEVIRSESYLTQDGKHIYTSSTIDIYKILKGNLTCGTIEVLTRGGTVGDLTEWISHNLTIKEGMKGVFLCDETQKELSTIDFYPEDNILKLDFPYDEQGYIKYFEDKFNVRVNDYSGAQLDSLAQLYDLVELYAQINYIDCKPNSPIINDIPNFNVSTTDTAIKCSIVNTQITGTTPKYLEFDIALADDIPSIYFYFANLRIQYDTSTFSSNIWASNKIWFTRGALIADTYTYKDPQNAGSNNDHTRNIVNVPIIGYSTITRPNPNYIDLSSIPIIAIHVKMEIDDCSHASQVKQVMGLSADYVMFARDPHNGPYSQYHWFEYGHPINFGGCNGMHIFDISPSIIAGGVGDTVTITGIGFDTTQGTGNIFLKESDNGGSFYIQLDPRDIHHWDDNVIKFTMPGIVDKTYTLNSEWGVPGTGPLKVENSSGDSAIGFINVLYSLKSTMDLTTGEKNIDTPFDRSLNSDQGGINYFLDSSIYNHQDRTSCIRTAMDDWICLSNMHFEIRGNTIANSPIAINDKNNIIQFGHIPAPKLAETYTYVVNIAGCKRPYTWSDMVFNEGIIPTLFCDTNKCDTMPANLHDLYAIAIHEFGHAHGLNHVNDPDAIMYYSLILKNIPTYPWDRKVWLEYDLSADSGAQRAMINALDPFIPNCVGGGINIIPIHPPGCPIRHRLSSTSADCHAPPWIFVPEVDKILNGISIYPNPVDDKLFVEINSDFEAIINLQVCDYTGRELIDVIKVKPVHGIVEIDISRFTSGIYILKFMSETVINGIKFIKN